MNFFAVNFSCAPLRAALCGIAVAMIVGGGMEAGQSVAESPNVLLICVDDLNDWIGCMGGHPQASTPNIDRLAASGTLFTDAHCAAPLCNPSRAAFFTGRYPHETGVLANRGEDIRQSADAFPLLTRRFADAGYETLGAGKLLHSGSGSLVQKGFFPHQRWSPFSPKQVRYSPEEIRFKGTSQQRHQVNLAGQAIVLPLSGVPSDRHLQSDAGESFDWGGLPIDDEAMGDGQVARWAEAELKKPHDRPFFLAVGFYRPHIPLWAPQKYFDLFDEESIVLPTVYADDLEDLGPSGKAKALEADTAGLHASVVKHNQWRAATKAYLACVAFIDAQVGVVLDALENGPHRADTIVVLWSDHGWHLGEKQHWGKWTLWDRATRSPLVVRLDQSRVSSQPKRIDHPVSLLDVYPTLLEAARVDEEADDRTEPSKPLAGKSLLPLLLGGEADTGREVVITCDLGNYAVVTSRYRYVRYVDGDEELYDRAEDPGEHHNLVRDTRYEEALATMHVRLERWERLRGLKAAGTGVAENSRISGQ